MGMCRFSMKAYWMLLFCVGFVWKPIGFYWSLWVSFENLSGCISFLWPLSENLLFFLFCFMVCWFYWKTVGFVLLRVGFVLWALFKTYRFLLLVFCLIVKPISLYCFLLAFIRNLQVFTGFCWFYIQAYWFCWFLFVSVYKKPKGFCWLSIKTNCSSWFFMTLVGFYVEATSCYRLQ